jgi:hypothetical protein
MSTPIEERIQLISLSLAFADQLQWMDGYGTHPSVFLQKLDAVTGRDGQLLKLNDPAVMAFIEYLGLNPCEVPTSLGIHAALSKRQRYGYSDPAELAGLSKIMALRSRNGWAELDRLLNCCYECTLTNLFGRVRIAHHTQDTAPVGDCCYEIRIFTTTTGDDLGMISQYAMASSQDFIFHFVDMIVSGEMEVRDPFVPSKLAVVTEIQVLYGKATVLSAVMNYRVTVGLAEQNKPLSINGSVSSVLGDASILKHMARTFSGHELQVLKGKLLEDSIGL